MSILKKMLFKYEGKAYHTMSKETWKKYKQSTNKSSSSSLIWGCALLLAIDIVLLILVLTRIISNRPEDYSFLIYYHISVLVVFSLSAVILNIREKHSEIKWLKKIDAGFILSIFALGYSVLYTIFKFNIDGQIVFYAIGLIFCVYFLRERPLVNTLIYLASLAAIIISATILVSDQSVKSSIIFDCSIITAATILISINIFKYRIQSYYINNNLSRLVTIDSLTGLNNRFSYNKYISEKRIVCPAVVCIFDMDNLKEVNDTLGHLEGDKCLVAIANSLSASFEFSFLARIGGDEFVAILGSTTLSAAFPKIEKFRSIISKKTDGLPSISVSLGYCKLNINTSYNEAYIKAENMMYAEKNKKKLLA